ncbi:MAG: ATPase [Muribaculaceae bacterium]|nr:ATPase [Muribaculaceae bacterium]MDE6792950.1 ATPase [Muribaculaceae bacterium]
MKSKLLIDAGSTKVEWQLIPIDNSEISSFFTEGVNALLADTNHIRNILIQGASQIPSEYEIESIHYYGAGCATPSICSKINEVIHSVWDNTYCEVNSDLLAAARSLFGERKGIACILGTGSNSCLYDGKQITMQIPSLGFILGDEGSGAALGKRLISDVFKEQLPPSVKDLFLEKYKLTLSDILEKVYTQPAPNKFLASLVPFLKDNLWNPYIYSLVLKELHRFVKRNVAMYPGAHALEVRFTGSIAYHFQKLLKEAASSLGYSVTSVTMTPMQGLKEYHKY